MKYIKYSDHADIIDYLCSSVWDCYVSYMNDNTEDIEIIDIENEPKATHLINLSNVASECAECHARFLIEASKVNFCPNCGRVVIKELEE